jgi:hypothetical protein
VLCCGVVATVPALRLCSSSKNKLRSERELGVPKNFTTASPLFTGKSR